MRHLLLILILTSLAPQTRGGLRGQVMDELGGLIVNATVTIKDAHGLEMTTSTDERGEYEFNGLASGRFTLRVTAPGFSIYENSVVEIVSGNRLTQNVRLRVALDREEVSVGTASALSTEPENNAGAIILRGEDLEALPDEPDDLANALQALAGPVAGPSGGQILIDGFLNTGQPLPPRASIREVRINQNPFSAENDRLGFGQIQILTRPGTDRWRGEGFFGISDESLNSRNPFAQNRAPYQSRMYGGSIGGPLVKRRATLFFNFERREVDDNAVVNATILDPSLNITPFAVALLTPQRRTSFSPRIDYQLNKEHTLTLRYSFFRFSNESAGIGGFSLPERAYRVTDTIQTFQLTETAILSQRLLNELRLQYIYENRIEYGDSTRPTISVQEAFTGGGPQIGLEENPEGRLWIQNNTTFVKGYHTLRAGARLRLTTIEDISYFNFGGAYTFGGGLAPLLNERGEPVRDAGGQIILAPITSIERYRRTLVFQRQGLTPQEIRALGGGATQFSITGGDPRAGTRQWDFGAFIQDDWRVRPSLNLSLGLRYETQTNIAGGLNLAPRISFAWAPNAKLNSQPQTVIRGGFGIFYDRFNENFVVTANRYNGIAQQQFVVSDPAILDLFPNVPSIETVAANSTSPQTVRRIASDLREPYTMQAAISIERQLPYKTTVTLTFVTARTLHALRSRNINAPVPGTILAGVPGSGVRPFGDALNIIQFESSGRVNQNQLILAINNRLSNKFTFSANYTFGKTSSDTDSLGTTPANSYDLSGEYGRSSLDVRHFLTLTGTFNVPFGIRINPLIIASTGRPFNIITGRDTNGDTLFTERPALATDSTKPGIITTPFGAFDPNPGQGQQIIPRNFAEGPGFFIVNLNVSRTYSFGEVTNPSSSNRAGANAAAEKRYGVTIAVRAQNLFNRTNGGTPVGNLSSSRFGQSISSAGSFGFAGTNPSAGNRRVEVQVRFTF